MYKILTVSHLFLKNRHDVTNTAELVSKQLSLTDKKKEVLSEKSGIYKERARFKPLFGSELIGH